MGLIKLTIFITLKQLILSVERPIILFHGMGQTCKFFDKVIKSNPRFECLDFNKGFFNLNGIQYQSESACKALKNAIDQHEDQLRYDNGVYLLGLSMGGMVARGMLHYCPSIKGIVKGLLTMGSPNLGIDEAPNLIIPYDDDGILMKFGKKMAGKFFLEAQSSSKTTRIGPLKLINKFEEINEIQSENYETGFTTDQDVYDINFEQRKNIDFDNVLISKHKRFFVKKPAYEILELMQHTDHDFYSELDVNMHFAFLQDYVVLPMYTHVFGANVCLNKDKTKYIIDFKGSSAYRKDYFGFKRLYDEGRVTFCYKDAEHAVLDENDYAAIDDILSTTGCDEALGDSGHPSSLTFHRNCIEKKLHNAFLENYDCAKEPLDLEASRQIKGDLDGFGDQLYRSPAFIGSVILI